MNIPIFILIVVFASEPLVKAETGNNPGTLEPIHLGQVDGKNYFYEHGIAYRNWTEAGDYCKEAGMQLATIETPAQAEFLISKYFFGVFYGAFWTAGQDAHLPREFTWNTTGTVATEIGLPWNVYNQLEYQTCVLYLSTTSPGFYMQTCASATTGVLCQT